MISISSGELLGTTRRDVADILAESADFQAVEAPPLPPPHMPDAIMSLIADTATICAWHDGGRGKLEAEWWARASGYRKLSHGCCARCAAALKAGTWAKL